MAFQFNNQTYDSPRRLRIPRSEDTARQNTPIETPAEHPDELETDPNTFGTEQNPTDSDTDISFQSIEAEPPTTSEEPDIGINEDMDQPHPFTGNQQRYLLDAIAAGVRAAFDQHYQNPAPVPTVPTPTTPKGEVRLNPPDAFSGEHAKAREFMRACKLYLSLNGHVYATDARQISFVLSYMRSGRSAEWAQYWATKIAADATETIGEFWKAFEKAFISSDTAADARVKLHELRQTGTADEYNAQFQTLAAQGEIKEYNSLLELYQRGLKRAILDRIYNMNDLPKDKMENWYEAAARFDNHHRRLMQVITGQPIFRSSAARDPAPAPAPTPDPNAMDIDRLTTNQREQYRREGRCFECGGKGHRVAECNQRQNRRNPRSGRFEKRRVHQVDTGPVTLTPKERAVQMRALTQGMSDDQYEEFLKEVGEDFQSGDS